MSGHDLYAAVYVRELPAQAMLRLRPSLQGQPCVILDGVAPSEFACSLNAKARRCGATYGMTRVELETIAGLITLLRSAVEEEQARVIVQEVAGAFTPRIETRSWDGAFLCALDISGTESLFGAPVGLVRELLKRVRNVGITATVAVSGNFHAALCMARGMFGRMPVTIIPTGEEQSRLAPLPLRVLELDESQAATFAAWGVDHLGQLAALPEKSLIARMGQDGKRLREMASGTRPHLFQPVDVPFTLSEEIELENPIELLEPLLFVLNMMLDQLIRRATDRILALASVAVSLVLDGGAIYTRTVSPPLPTNERALWLKLVQMDLEMHPPQAAIHRVRLEAEPGQTSKVQLGLFSPQLPEPGRLEVTLARIAKIVGEDAVGQMVLRDTHQPQSFRMEKFRVPASPPLADESRPPQLVMRELRPTETVSVSLTEGRPSLVRFRNVAYRVERAYGPWLVAGDWWNPEHWGQAQWDLILRDDGQGMLSCCILRDLKQRCWQIVGFYD